MKPVVFGTTARIQPLPHWGPPDSFPCSPFGVLQTPTPRAPHHSPALPRGLRTCREPRELGERVGTLCEAKRQAPAFCLALAFPGQTQWVLVSLRPQFSGGSALETAGRGREDGG